MFTIKLYNHDSCRQVIYEAESFIILRSPKGPSDDGGAEITVFEASGRSFRADVSPKPPNTINGECYDKAIIENSSGRTTEIIALRPIPPRVA